MAEEGPIDPGRADFVPTGEGAQYSQRFKIDDKVWMSTKNDPDIVVYVKEAFYDKAKESWMYKVQEKKEEKWIGKERWKKETALGRA